MPKFKAMSVEKGDMKRSGGMCGLILMLLLSAEPAVLLLFNPKFAWPDEPAEPVGLSELLAGDLEALLLVPLLLLFLLQPPPTGTLRRAPPLVQYLLQVLQKWRGCVRL